MSGRVSFAADRKDWGAKQAVGRKRPFALASGCQQSGVATLQWVQECPMEEPARLDWLVVVPDLGTPAWEFCQACSAAGQPWMDSLW